MTWEVIETRKAWHSHKAIGRPIWWEHRVQMVVSWWEMVLGRRTSSRLGEHVCAQPLSCVQLFCDPLDRSSPDSSVHEIFQARILERVTIPFSKESSQLRDWTCVSCIGRRIITTEPPWKPIRPGKSLPNILRTWTPLSKQRGGQREPFTSNLNAFES